MRVIEDIHIIIAIACIAVAQLVLIIYWGMTLPKVDNDDSNRPLPPMFPPF
jgi:hypothetical protein